MITKIEGAIATWQRSSPDTANGQSGRRHTKRIKLVITSS